MICFVVLEMWHCTKAPTYFIQLGVFNSAYCLFEFIHINIIREKKTLVFNKNCLKKVFRN